MPWKAFKIANEFCVFRIDSSGERFGSSKGCHSNRSEANDQIAALNISENKDNSVENPNVTVVESEVNQEEVEEIIEEKDKTLVEVDTFDVVMSFEDLRQQEEAQERADAIRKTIHDTRHLVDNVLVFADLDEQPSLLGKIVNGFRDRLSFLTNSVMKQKITPFMVFKEKDEWRFLTTYSNNIRDDDNPPEIISAASHRKFADMVDKGIAPLPELWLAHVKELVIGEVDVIAFDDETGVAMAAGHFHEFAAPVAKAISDNSEAWGVSHGMIVHKRNVDDPTIIEHHITKEISPLAHDKAANRWADFVALKEANMSLTQEKLDEFETLGIGGAVIANIQEHNAKLSKQADEIGLERKEGEEIPPEETPPAEVPPVEPKPVATPEVPEAVEEVEEETVPEVPLVETVEETPEAPATEEAVEEVVETPAPSSTPPSETPEVETPATEEVVTEEVPAETAPVTEFTEGQTEELKSVLTTVATNIIETIEKKLDEKLAPVLKARNQKDDFMEEFLDQTPSTSWQQDLFEPIINGTILRKQSAIGNETADLDKRLKLAKDAPSENKEEESILQSGNSFTDLIATDLATGRVLDPLLEKELAA